MRWLVLLLLAGPASASPLLVHVAPDVDNGLEGVALWSDTPLAGWTLTDGESSLRFDAPAGLTWFLDEPQAWARFGIEGQAWDVQLGNSGDDVSLRDPDGRTVDAFAWGEGRTDWMDGSVAHVTRNIVYTRSGGPGAYTDTDQAADWITPRRHRVGESAIAPQTWTTEVTLYASPDNAFAILTALIEGARERLHLHVYELRHQALVDRLVDAARRGVDVQVLVDAQPVGLEPWERHETAGALQRIEAAGGMAVLAGKQRYAFHHLKVLVADGAVAVQTENWVPSGVPQDASWGNRGWGAVVHDDAAADWFAAWMQADRAAWDSTPFDLATYDPHFEAPPRFAPATGTYRPSFTPRSVRAEVTAFIGPDATAAHDPSAALAAAAQDRVLVQHMDLSRWATNPLGYNETDPLFAALQRTPAPAHVMVAAPFRHGDTGNQEALAELDVDGRVWARDLMVLHSKAVLADDALALGSMNGNHHSRSENREVLLVIRSSEAADAFAAMFWEDWDATTPRQWGVIADDLRGIPAPSLIAALLVGLAWRSRPSTR